MYVQKAYSYMGCLFLAAYYVVSAEAQCPSEKIIEYEMILRTFWSRTKFPKHYPDWKPSAQWSKIVGRTHSRSYTLFRLGTRASIPVKIFIETGNWNDSTTIDSSIYQEFTTPPIESGVGQTNVNFFVEGKHSLMSLIVKMIPSPDWFIGIDSFDLCINEQWIESMTIKVDPFDAGIDNGFTFTAPDWPTTPQGVTYHITAHYPTHPAGSFFYSHLKHLPPIAIIELQKIHESQMNAFLHKSKSGKFRNCIVSKWSSWSSCNKSCEMQRSRKILHRKKRRGRHCPPLLQIKKCHNSTCV